MCGPLKVSREDPLRVIKDMHGIEWDRLARHRNREPFRAMELTRCVDDACPSAYYDALSENQGTYRINEFPAEVT